MNPLSLAFILSPAAITVKLDIAAGAAISGDHKFTAQVQTQSVVSNVEFYANGELISTDDSQPYEFQLDTLRYDDGPLKVRAAAFDRSGGRAEQTLDLRVENGLSLGAAHHLRAAEEAFTAGEWAKAAQSGRIALRIDPAANAARLVLARAQNQLKRPDLAQKHAEDILESEPANREALTLVAAISLDRAMSTFTSRLTTQATVDSLARSLKRAAEAARAAALADAEGLSGLAKARALYRLGDAEGAARILEQAEAPSSDEARLVRGFARLALGDRARALTDLAPLAASAPALAASALASPSREQSSSLEAKSAQISLTGRAELSARALLALQNSDLFRHSAITAILKQSHPAAAETAYHESIQLYHQRQFEASQDAVKRGLLADPLMAELAVERAAQTVAFVITNNALGPERLIQLSLADAFADAALAARPGSPEAAAIRAITALLRSDAAASKPWLEIMQAGRAYPSGLVIAAAAELQDRRTTAARDLMARASKLDPSINERLLPTPTVAFQQFYRSGRLPRVALP